MCTHKKIKVGTQLWIHGGFYRCVERPGPQFEDPLERNFAVQKLPLFETSTAGAIFRVSGAMINALEGAGQLVILRDDAARLRVRADGPERPMAPRAEPARA